jgi:hypothetical protein
MTLLSNLDARVAASPASASSRFSISGKGRSRHSNEKDIRLLASPILNAQH